ncbi:hypothetical protein V6Z12_A01G139600 [Gossypium hirsutum]
MEEFRSALEDYGLNDLGYKGRWFKWERGRIFSTNIRERLDRGVVSIDWLNLFSNCKVEHLSHAFSDHCPILLDTIGKQRFDHAEGLKLFRFEASWCLENSFEKIIKRKWESLIGSVPSKLELLGRHLHQWDRARIREKKRGRFGLEEKLNKLYYQEPTDEILAEILDAQLKINLKADQDEVFWEQKARINWLKNGDRNTSFFHKIAVQCHLKGRINGLESDEGSWVSTTDEMLHLAVKYFDNLFSASEEGADDRLFGFVEKQISTNMNVDLLRHFTEEEIRAAVRDMVPLKAPGNDGFP